MKSVAMVDDTPSLTVKKTSVAQAVQSVPKKEEGRHKTAAGFLLMDSSLRPAWCNAEAIRILSYPDQLANLRHSRVLLTARIRSSLVSRHAHGESPFVPEFHSGRRRYFCRPFLVDSYAGNPSRSYIAVLLERRPSGLAPLSEISRLFNLTEREREALEYLLQGLGNKAIANRMNISPNTVKAYMRTIMIKTGATSRSAMLRTIILGQLQ